MLPIESYIQGHDSSVKEWVTKAIGNYLIIYMYDSKKEISIDAKRICNDDRRLSKCLEVLKFFKLLESTKCQNDPRDRKHTLTSVSLNLLKVLELAPQYGIKPEFNIKTPDNTMDRVLGYPTLYDIGASGVIYIFTHLKEYNVYERLEKHTHSYGSRTETKRVIRVYPKNLESNAERSVFEKALMRYYSKNIPEALEAMFGLKVNYLQSHQQYATSDTLIKDIDLDRVNNINLCVLQKDNVNKALDKAYQMKEYIDASIKELEALVSLVPESEEEVRKIALEKLEAAAYLKAPLMMMSDKEDAKNLATLILKGSNKGII